MVMGAVPRQAELQLAITPPLGHDAVEADLDRLCLLLLLLLLALLLALLLHLLLGLLLRLARRRLGLSRLLLLGQGQGQG